MAIILHDIQPRDTHMAPRSAAHPPGWSQVGRAKAPDPGPAAVRRGNLMDDVNRFARELADAIAAAAADHPKVEACRERARAAVADRSRSPPAGHRPRHLTLLADHQ